MEEHEVFDYYKDILQLKTNETVQCGMPTYTPEANRMIYITKNKKSLAEKQILLLPYLHERKIFLSRTKKECEYFNTSMQKTTNDN